MAIADKSDWSLQIRSSKVLPYPTGSTTTHATNLAKDLLSLMNRLHVSAEVFLGGEILLTCWAAEFCFSQMDGLFVTPSVLHAVEMFSAIFARPRPRIVRLVYML